MLGFLKNIINLIVCYVNRVWFVIFKLALYTGSLGINVRRKKKCIGVTKKILITVLDLFIYFKFKVFILLFGFFSELKRVSCSE